MKKYLKQFLFLNYLLLFFCLAKSIAQPHTYRQANFIKTVQLYQLNDPLSFAVTSLGNLNSLELHFDDMQGAVKNYYYSLELCNADWTACNLTPFQYLKGFSQTRITNYRNSSVTPLKYTHYQVQFPDKNMLPIKSGNYLLRVYFNGDTANTVLTRKVLVVDNKVSINASINQPFSPNLFKTYQKVLLKVDAKALNVANVAQQLKVIVLQNQRWDNAKVNVKPNFVYGFNLEYSNDNDMSFDAENEWRWIDLRSFRFKSDRIKEIEVDSATKGIKIYAAPDGDRRSVRYVRYTDYNGKFYAGTTENINPLWQTDYALIHFTYLPQGMQQFLNQDVYLLGDLAQGQNGFKQKLSYNSLKGLYETNLYLKQGYYTYAYATANKNEQGLNLKTLENSNWETENGYQILIYYRPWGARADELVGFAELNSFNNNTLKN